MKDKEGVTIFNEPVIEKDLGVLISNNLKPKWTVPISISTLFKNTFSKMASI